MLRRLLLGQRKPEECDKKSEMLQTLCNENENENESEESDSEAENDETSEYSSLGDFEAEDSLGNEEELQGFQMVCTQETREESLTTKEGNNDEKGEVLERSKDIKSEKLEDETEKTFPDKNKEELVNCEKEGENNKNNTNNDDNNDVNNNNTPLTTTSSPEEPKTPPPTPDIPDNPLNTPVKSNHGEISQGQPALRKIKPGGKIHAKHTPCFHQRNSKLNIKHAAKMFERPGLKNQPQKNKYNDFKVRVSEAEMGKEMNKVPCQFKSGKFDISVNDLEKILGINIGELQEVISKSRMEKTGSEVQQGINGDPGEKDTPDDSGQVPVIASGDETLISQAGLGKDNTGTYEDSKHGISKDSKDHSSSGTQEKVGNDKQIGARRSPDGCHAEGNREQDIKDEISSDSGVSEGNGDTEASSPEAKRYMTKRSMVKYKVYLERKITQLEARMVTMVEDKKDAQFIYDLMDLHNDELKSVKRNNVGVPCVAGLKDILGRQIQEMTDSEFQTKMKSLQQLRIPCFSTIYKNIEKLQIKTKDCLQDDRKCRSKSVQNMRFDVGKILGMCQGMLDCVYEE